MPTNESIVAVPLNVEHAGQTRQFLVRLVEKLDIVLGYRGNDPYVSASQIGGLASQDNLTQLEQTVLDIVTQLFTENSEVVTTALRSITDGTSESIESLKSSSTINDVDDTTQTISATPTQTEVQNIQDQVVDIAEGLNDLLAALRGTEIIAT